MLFYDHQNGINVCVAELKLMKLSSVQCRTMNRWLDFGWARTSGQEL